MAAGFHFNQLNNQAIYLYRRYESELVNFHRKKLQLQFLKKCLQEQVIPKTLDYNLKCDYNPFPEVKRLILQDSILNAREEISKSHFLTRQRFNYLRYYVYPQELGILTNIAHQKARNNANRHRAVLDNKLSALCSNSCWTQHSSSRSVINMSSVVLNDNQMCLLGLGLSFSLPPPSNSTIDLVAYIDQFIRRNDQHLSNPDILRGTMLPYLLNLVKQGPFLPKRLHDALRSLKKNKNIVIFPADKGGKPVVMDTQEYINKANNLLSDQSTYQEVISDPTNNVNRNFRKNLRQIASRCPQPKFFDKFYTTNARLPYFYGIPKVHKPNCPLRPIISSVGSISHSLSSWLASILTPYLGTFSGSHLKNTDDFMGRLREFSRNNSMTHVRMISFDVTSLFTNVPLDDVLDFIRRKCQDKCIELPIPVDAFLDLIKLCVSNNYFSFNYKFYLQTFGVAMGSALSPVLANIYMEFFESELLPTLPTQPLLWIRYVDDIFAIWSSEDDVDSFLRDLNALAPSIKFTVEWENDAALPFLDVVVHRELQCFQFSVYRKPTHSGMYLHYYSWHPQYVKKSVMYSMFLRAFRICDPLYIAHELQYIKSSFSRLGYPPSLIQTALSDAKRKFHSVNIPRQDREKQIHLSLPHSKSNNFVRTCLKSSNISLISKQSNSLKKQLIQTGSKTHDADTAVGPGVYVVPCQDCDSCYVGETGRALSVRLGEHKANVRYARESSAFFVHVRDHEHRIKWDAAKLVFSSQNKHKRLIIESALIKHLPNFNLMPGVCSVDKSYRDFLLHNNPKLIRNIAQFYPI